MKWGALLLLTTAVGAPGCLERKIHVTSEPPGAAVWINDVEVGRTPLTTGFTYYGTYDVRVRKDGFAPVWTSRPANTPLWECPPVDIFAMAVPVTIEKQVEWDFKLSPSEPEDLPSLVKRAGEMKSLVTPRP